MLLPLKLRFFKMLKDPMLSGIIINLLLERSSVRRDLDIFSRAFGNCTNNRQSNIMLQLILNNCKQVDKCAKF